MQAKLSCFGFPPGGSGVPRDFSRSPRQDRDGPVDLILDLPDLDGWEHVRSVVLSPHCVAREPRLFHSLLRPPANLSEGTTPTDSHQETPEELLRVNPSVHRDGCLAASSSSLDDAASERPTTNLPAFIEPEDGLG